MAKQKVKMESGSKSPTKTPAKPEKNTKRPVEKEQCPADELRFVHFCGLGDRMFVSTANPESTLSYFS